AMNRSHIPVLAEVLEFYYTYPEIEELASIFDVTLPRETIWKNGGFSWLGVARQLIEQIDYGNHYEMLKSILASLEQRNITGIARTDWERRDAHEHATPKIVLLTAALGEPGIAREIVVAELRPFTAKAEVREFLDKAATPILVVDPYVGVGTLDCLRTMK